MRKRILALLLCVGMALTGFVYTVADSSKDGDANGDGKVSASDAALVLRYVVGLDDRMSVRGMLNADINGNGEIEASDAASILRYVAGLASLTTTATDAETLALLNVQSLLSEDMMEWSARFIYHLPAGNVRKVIYEGAKLLGNVYSEMDCSTFVKTAFKNAGIASSVYPGKSSDGTLNWFRTNHPEQLHQTNMNSFDDWSPGCVLIYINQSQNKATHLALYVGKIAGQPVVMESRKGGCDGVRIGIRMEDYTNEANEEVVLSYYVDPLG